MILLLYVALVILIQFWCPHLKRMLRSWRGFRKEQQKLLDNRKKNPVLTNFKSSICPVYQKEDLQVPSLQDRSTLAGRKYWILMGSLI